MELLSAVILLHNVLTLVFLECSLLASVLVPEEEALNAKTIRLPGKSEKPSATGSPQRMWSPH